MSYSTFSEGRFDLFECSSTSPKASFIPRASLFDLYHYPGGQAKH